MIGKRERYYFRVRKRVRNILRGLREAELMHTGKIPSVSFDDFLLMLNEEQKAQASVATEGE